LPDGEQACDLDADLDLMTAVGEEAGRLALEWRERGARSWSKAPGDPVTEADLAVNDLIALRLCAARPDYGWLSEESPDDVSERRRRRVFVVDPIDGTRAFMKGRPWFSVCIGLVEDGQAVAGVIVAPALQETFRARRGGGAQLNGAGIRCRPDAALEGARLIVRPSQLAAALRPAAAGLEFMDDPPNSIAYRLALVAAGRWDGVVAGGDKWDWDLAAAAAILAESGATATDLEGRPLRFNGTRLRQPGVAAAGEMLHPLLMDAVRSIGRAA
jgi:myo-inositol-1(or 4)-monophosphatase